MSRPYFRHNVEQLYQAFLQHKGNPKELKVIQNELARRSVPKARALKQEVDTVLAQAGIAANSSTYRDISSSAATRPSPTPLPDAEVAVNDHKAPDRVVVECGYCKASNFVHVSEGTQHLSCSQCKRPYIAEFTYGMLRTTFPPLKEETKSKSPVAMWLVLGALVLAFLILMDR